MEFIELNYQTWEREDCFGLFDYSESKAIRRHEKIIVKHSLALHRNPLTYDLVPQLRQSAQQPISQPILKISVKDGRFYLSDAEKSSSEPLCIIVPHKQGLCLLREGDRIKLGKTCLQLLRVHWKKSNATNHYEQALEPKLSDKPSLFATSFYSHGAEASMIETNPACRFCYSRTINPNNPFLAVCSCAGHTKYIHLECLIEWVQKRAGQLQNCHKNGVYWAPVKALTCEVCQSLYKMDHLIKQVFSAGDDALNSYAIFYLHAQTSLIYVLDLGVAKQITVGRSLQCNLTINDLSVSRKHCSLTINSQRKTISVADNMAKFGTILEIKNREIDVITEFQKGRTKMKFNKIKKLSFFQKLGFCSPEENLRSQREHH